MVVTINIKVFWEVTPCILVHRYLINFHNTAILSKYELTAVWEKLNYFDRGYSDIVASFCEGAVFSPHPDGIRGNKCTVSHTSTFTLCTRWWRMANCTTSQLHT